MLGNESVRLFGLSTKTDTTRRSDGMSSMTKDTVRVNISHYCGYGGYGYANGCILTECNDEKTKKK